MSKKIFSGVQPTGNLHLGNYLGAIKNFVELNKKLIPVNYLVRKSEKKSQEEKRLFIENRFRVSQGLKPFLNFQDFLDSDPEEFNELSEKIVLEEAARILIDQINLNKPNRLSSSDFR